MTIRPIQASTAGLDPCRWVSRSKLVAIWASRPLQWIQAYRSFYRSSLPARLGNARAEDTINGAQGEFNRAWPCQWLSSSASCPRTWDLIGKCVFGLDGANPHRSSSQSMQHIRSNRREGWGLKAGPSSWFAGPANQTDWPYRTLDGTQAPAGTVWRRCGCGKASPGPVRLR
ncbi:hypothetical protein BS50DRAFT_303362 [Corynespora cassiicola Philippines]|uniref:Uncharacterized protein n=1 Tax=Corynespora cassiicola Philippines TaxID=1448308 RepID=A0A2T2NX97_CORCC|nr:hypothetical protein BS50DRAFT_303362 [Corynespora cassiicola Philippines]